MTEKENFTSRDHNSASDEAEFHELDNSYIAGSLIAMADSRDGLPLFETTNQNILPIREMIIRATRTNTGESGMDYESTVLALFNYANSQEDEVARNNAYIASLTVSLSDPDIRIRRNFIETVYATGQNEKVSKACESNLDLLIKARECDPANPQADEFLLHDLAAAFTVPREDFDLYMSRLDGGIDREPVLFSPSELQAQLCNVTTDFQDIEYLRSKAKQASVADEKVTGLHWDIYKIERFALQQKIMLEQLQAVLGDDLSRTPFAELLTERPASHYVDGSFQRGDTLEQLADDIQAAFRELTEPIIEEYDPEIIEDEHDLTEKHRVALRYREIAHYSKGIQMLGRYLDPERFATESKMARTISIPNEVWMGSEDGAAIAGFMQRALQPIVNAVRLQGGKLNIAAHDVRRLLHGDRRQLADIPMLNVSDFLLRTEVGFVDPLQLFTRDSKGQLQHLTPVKLEYGAGADMYAGATLGCIAARLVHPKRSDLSWSQREQYGYANYVDHIMALVINEAYSRGIFDYDDV